MNIDQYMPSLRGFHAHKLELWLLCGGRSGGILTSAQSVNKVLISSFRPSGCSEGELIFVINALTLTSCTSNHGVALITG
jgi:hypothetical protein